ncbi:hypothetical protein E2542_SST25264 [Spatholobus suberectus]|nr:hypothetical protein E2542_SST25264 [Spatholobus suberectus]
MTRRYADSATIWAMRKFRDGGFGSAGSVWLQSGFWGVDAEFFVGGTTIWAMQGFRDAGLASMVLFMVYVSLDIPKLKQIKGLPASAQLQLIFKFDSTPKTLLVHVRIYKERLMVISPTQTVFLQGQETKLAETKSGWLGGFRR